MPTAKTLRRWSQQAEDDRVRWKAEGDKWHAMAKIAERQRDQWAREADEMDALNTTSALHAGDVKSRVNVKNMHAQHKLAISEGQAKRDKKFKETIRESGYTQASLAAAIGMQASLLSMCRSGERAMFMSRAKRIEQLTGWPADKAHWLGGLIEDA